MVRIGGKSEEEMWRGRTGKRRLTERWGQDGCTGEPPGPNTSPQRHGSMFIAPASDEPPSESCRCQLLGINIRRELVCTKLGKGPREQSVGSAMSSIPGAAGRRFNSVSPR